MKNSCIPFLICCLLVFSCDKKNISSNNENPQTPPDYSGTYDCEKSSSWFSINDPNGNGDTTYQSTLDVFQTGDTITINGFTFHVDSVANENTYTEYEGSSSYKTIRFYSNDSIYYKRCSGSLGGSYSSIYIGTKM